MQNFNVTIGADSIRNVKQHNVIHTLQKRYHNLNRYRPDVLEEFDVEAIHRFRLEIKKLRAFLRLLNGSGEQQKGLRIGRKLRDFYHAAGNVRCLQLQKEMVLQWCRQFHYAEPLAYLAILHQKEEEAKILVREEGQLLSLEKEESRVLKAAHHGFDDRLEQAFVALKKAALVQFLSAFELNDETLHSIRKVLKDLLYVWNWIGPFIEEAFDPKHFNRDACIKLTDRLGDFQDLCIAMTFLTTDYLDAVPDLQEKTVLQRLHTYCVGRKAEVKKASIFLLQPLRRSLLCPDRLPAVVSTSSFQLLNNSI